jgi:RimJ/RimL family protein N-acetyltransferase
MTKLFNIRVMQENDVPFFLEVRNECREYLDNDKKYTLNECSKWFWNKKLNVYIIEYNGHKIGYFRTSDENLKNKSIWVGADLHKDFRGKGLSKKMYMQFLDDLYEEGFDTFILNVLEINDRAINLYKKLGFKEEKVKNNTVIRGDGKSYDRIRMRLKYEKIS